MEPKTENEKKKEYLKSYQDAVRREKHILQEIQLLRMDKMLPSVINDGMPHGSGCSDLSDYMVLLDEQINELRDERLEKMLLYKEIEKRIRNMDNDNEREVLRLRYLRGMTWEEVAVEMGYSWRGIHNIHGKALSNFQI